MAHPFHINITIDEHFKETEVDFDNNLLEIIKILPGTVWSIADNEVFSLVLTIKPKQEVLDERQTH